MPFEKGRKKTGGKKKGTSNKTTEESKKIFNAMMSGEMTNLKTALKEVYDDDKARYLNIVSRYFPYFLPKQIEADITIDNTELPFSISIESRKNTDPK